MERSISSAATSKLPRWSTSTTAPLATVNRSTLATTKALSTDSQLRISIAMVGQTSRWHGQMPRAWFTSPTRDRPTRDERQVQRGRQRGKGEEEKGKGSSLCPFPFSRLPFGL